MPKRMTPELFWSSKTVTASGCWEWSGCRQRYGHNTKCQYGTVGFRGRRWLAHRLAWFLTHGDLARSLLICHRCDNPICINPSHLFVGTQVDNMADMRIKGRRRGRGLGEWNGRAKLTWSDVAEMRDLYALDRQTWKQTILAEKFGVSQGLVSAILRKRNWKSAAA